MLFLCFLAAFFFLLLAALPVAAIGSAVAVSVWLPSSGCSVAGSAACSDGVSGLGLSESDGAAVSVWESVLCPSVGAGASGEGAGFVGLCSSGGPIGSGCGCFEVIQIFLRQKAGTAQACLRLCRVFGHSQY